jgi:CubicO group peptidase (beta-lactamase class C family)
MRSRSRTLPALALLAVALLAQTAPAQKPAPPAHTLDITAQPPESAGFSSERLERLHDYIKQLVDAKHLAGAVTILARHGKIIDSRTWGESDMALHKPIAKDTIFRAYSMTKPTTGVAMMILYEQGKWLPSDPISKFIPEFAHLKVYKGLDTENHIILGDPEHPPTMRELMSHSAGFSYGNDSSPVAALYKQLDPQHSANLQEMIDKLAKLPLNYEPGHGWLYSLSMDIEGYIVEKLSGQSLPDFDRDHIFTPLGMNDTGFYVPADKRPRFAVGYHEDKGELVAEATENGIPTDYDKQPTMPSGGGGLLTTAMDYYRFAQMLANGGELDGKRILAPATVKLMASNHLADDVIHGNFGIGQHRMRPGFGYGYNVAVVYDPAEANLPDGKGTFFWDGAAGTWFWVDPTNDLVFVGMIQRRTSPDNHALLYTSHALVYQALVDPSK